MGERPAERGYVPAPGSASFLAQPRQLTHLDPDDHKASERDMLTNINYTCHHKRANISGPEFFNSLPFPKMHKVGSSPSRLIVGIKYLSEIYSSL